MLPYDSIRKNIHRATAYINAYDMFFCILFTNFVYTALIHPFPDFQKVADAQIAIWCHTYVTRHPELRTRCFTTRGSQDQSAAKLAAWALNVGSG